MSKSTAAFLTTKDVCEIFNRNAMTIYLWRRDLEMPVVKIPGDQRDNVRFNWKDVEAWALKNDKTINRTALNRILRKRQQTAGTMGFRNGLPALIPA